MDIRDIFGDVPGRPDHPDFWNLSQNVLALDAAIQDDPSAVQGVIEKYVDSDSIEYFSVQRASSVVRAGMAPAQALPMLAAIYCEGFVLGCMVEQAKAATS